ncbi:MAG: chloride channel protein [Pirellulaceae bacterium]|nr:MAG: chloride channel protein [Pirellulaceae bacterium]
MNGSRLGRWLAKMDLRTPSKWLVLSLLIGCVAGLGAVVFQWAVAAVTAAALHGLAGYHPLEVRGEAKFFQPPQAEFSPWLLVVVAAGGGLLAGGIVNLLAPEAAGHGTDAAIEAYHQKKGYLRPLVPVVKTIASAITLGTGGSGGREGPIAQIGAGFGSLMGTWLRLPARDRRIMLAAGMGAGVGAVFRAPLAGALFAAEILYSSSDLEADVLPPAAMASITAYTVYCLVLPPELRFVPLFGSGLHHPLHSLSELAAYAVLALVLVLGVILHVTVFYRTHDFFAERVRLPDWLKPAVGAGLAAALGLALFYTFDDPAVLSVLSVGYGVLQKGLEDAHSVAIGVLIAVALGKILTTALSIGSGGSGGVFGPSIVIGGCLGLAVGKFFHEQFPDWIRTPEAFGLVGMAGFFAGAGHAPISTIIMVSEMTGDYALLLPSMFVSTLCFVLCLPWKLYRKQVPTRRDSPAHRGEFIVDLLEDMRVAEARSSTELPVQIPVSLRLADVMQVLTTTQQHVFPVVDGNGQIVGIFSADDVRSYIYDQTVWPLAVAADIMRSPAVVLEQDEDLNSALGKFIAINVDELPVVDRQGRLVGMLRHKDLISAYNRRLWARRKEQDEQTKG